VLLPLCDVVSAICHLVCSTSLDVRVAPGQLRHARGVSGLLLPRLESANGSRNLHLIK
jgi:hypothetical protein